TAPSLPTQAKTPDATPKDSASDLVSQAFDNPKTPERGEVEPKVEPKVESEGAATGEAEPEVAAKAEAVVEAEPVAEAEAESQVVAKGEAKPEVAAKAEAEPEAAAKVEAEAAAEPKVDTKPKVDAEPKVDVKPEPAAKAKTELAPEPEPEPEAKAEAEAAPTATSPKPETAPQPETAPEPPTTPTTSSTPTSPTPLAKIESQAPGLVSLYKAARVSLEKQGLATQRAAVYLVLDRSGSMRNYYKDGTVQHLAEQALGLSANLDDDGTVPVVFFSTDVDGTAELDLASYEGRIEELHAGLGHMGRTNYHWAINAVIEHYEKSGATDPAFVIFQTDGAPTSKPAAEKALCEAAKLPIFWQFVGFGDPDAKGFDFLRKLDELAVPEKRVIDNAGFFHAGRDPRSLADADLYQQLMTEFPTWLTEARKSGILPD
ncbi:vWA domain-containing protein, partial [Streptomyces rimosus]